MKSSKLLSALCFVLFANISIAQQTFIYVSDAGGFNNPPWQVLKYDLDGTNPQVFIDNSFFTGEGIGWPQDILFLEDQNVVLISCLVGNRITKHDATTGAYIEDFATVSGGPTRMKIGPDNLLYVLQWSNTDNKVKRYQLDGTFVDEFTSAGVIQSIGLDWDSTGNLYVSSFGGARVRKFDPSGNDLGIFVNSELTGPTNIWFSDTGDLRVLDWSAGNVESFDSDGNYLGVFIPDLIQPEGIATLPNGNILIGNGGTGAVKMFDANGAFIEDRVPPGSGGLMQPNAVVLRDVVLSVPENSLDNIFVTPTLGTTFLLNNKTTKNYESLKVYDSSGKLVAELFPEKDQIWDASPLAEGIYFIVAIKNNQRLSQKIVVQKK